MTKAPQIDQDYLTEKLFEMLSIASPTGYTDHIVHYVSEELDKIGVPYELTRRGAIRATLEGELRTPDRAVVTHLDTLGAMVRELKDNGRLAIVSIGTWSPRFAEGARVRIFCDDGFFTGTILPLKAAGHIYGDAIDTQPVSWNNLEIRVDEKATSKKELQDLGFNIGDYVAVDQAPVMTSSGFINARHLDNKAGVACKLAAIKAVKESGQALPVDCHPLFTISEEEGTGASSVLHGDVSQMVAIDNSTVGPGQNSREDTVIIAMRDRGGIYDYHLTHTMIDLCKKNKIPYVRDVFRYYQSDATSAISAGNDIRTALVCFGLDASHGYERTHIDSLLSLSKLIYHYIFSEPQIMRDSEKLGPKDDFPTQPDELIDGEA